VRRGKVQKNRVDTPTPENIFVSIEKQDRYGMFKCEQRLCERISILQKQHASSTVYNPKSQE
jgi:hypothetical protein